MKADLQDDRLSLDSLKIYLATALLHVGPVRAGQIVERYGQATIQTLRDEPGTVANEIPGITLERAQEFASQLRATSNQLKTLEKFRTVLAPVRALKLIRTCPEYVLRMAESNPWLLQPYGLTFTECARLAVQFRVPLSGMTATQEATRHTLKQEAQDGHTVTDFLSVKHGAEDALRVALPAFEEALTVMQDTGLIGRGGNPRHVGLKRLLEAERYISDRLWTILRTPGVLHNDPTAAHPAGLTDGLTDGQCTALRQAWGAKVFVLGGAAGTGKTYLLRRYLQMMQKHTTSVKIVTPTGKAAQVASKATGLPVQTIHRALGIGPNAEWMIGETTYLDADLVICDEASMVDVELFAQLLAAVPDPSYLLIVGDPYQLPSVGPGTVLRDLLHTPWMPKYVLDEIVRQTAGLLLTNSQHVRRGELLTHPTHWRGKRDWEFESIDDPEQIQEWIVRHYVPHQTMVLTARREDSPIAVRELNAALQEEYNPDGARIAGTPFRVGDPVIQCTNNYELEIFNGDIGEILGTWKDDHDLPCVSIQFESKSNPLKGYVTDFSLQLARALTVHKAQGSEYPEVIVPVHQSQDPVTSRSWLYTALTRARERCVTVGAGSYIAKMIGNNVPLARRTSLLQHLANCEG